VKAFSKVGLSARISVSALSLVNQLHDLFVLLFSFFPVKSIVNRKKRSIFVTKKQNG
jgi:hypothetical protein